MNLHGTKGIGSPGHAKVSHGRVATATEQAVEEVTARNELDHETGAAR